MKSEGYRNIAGETLAYFHQRVIDIYGKETPVLVMGDFNDEPFNLSVTQYALFQRSRARVVRGSNPYLLNMMWKLMEQGVGTLFFNNEPNMLDRFLWNNS